MDKKKVIQYLLIANLAVILIMLIGKFEIVLSFIDVIFSIVVVPIVFGVFLFYILKPLNTLFRKKKMKKGKAAMLTMIIFFFIMTGVVKYFGDYFIQQFIILKDLFLRIAKERGIVEQINKMFNSDFNNVDYYGRFVGHLEKYIGLIIVSGRQIFNKGMQMFSDILLVILILFYLLKDGDKVEDLILKYTPNKYKNTMDKTLGQSNNVLSSYILGQATVAVSLAIMVYIGYRVIGMTSPIFLASITFILAFIPFIGFLISMIIPFALAISMGMPMVIKLSVLFLVAQTLKGRLVVPLIMGRAMKIHPITDIFLVVGAATLIGPIGAFVVVPIYALIKVFYRNFKPYILKAIPKKTS
ncbi:AI-2E family transporter [Clostridium gasigenes]|uniref:Predicted PurR-regulated permease PerM n=1 Tax=Clostridium gasigenes TaxID=94869 RepID=A0A1H0T4Q3_9CLOT|nr:AI-2E family transporter [Clostridium gasigenes]MBB6623777.1 AI-2E family transporter [Clostridium gasigenes]MBU3088909.1 AI-2E family transporter [Clostridium gasigenes]SDP48548.1 Predicted PurR-regulated permease PerM [Clostridium gasigenes]